MVKVRYVSESFGGTSSDETWGDCACLIGTKAPRSRSECIQRDARDCEHTKVKIVRCVYAVLDHMLLIEMVAIWEDWTNSQRLC